MPKEKDKSISNVEDKKQAEIGDKNPESENQYEAVGIMKSETSKPVIIASYRVPKPVKGFRKFFWKIFSGISSIVVLILFIISVNNCSTKYSIQKDYNTLKEEFKNQEEKYQELDEKIKIYENSHITAVNINQILNAANISSTELNHNEVTYLLFPFTVLKNFQEEQTLYVKLFNPNGNLIRDNNSPKGYSLTVNSYEHRIRWPNDNSTSYKFEKGEYVIEFWTTDKLVGWKKFVLK